MAFPLAFRPSRLATRATRTSRAFIQGPFLSSSTSAKSESDCTRPIMPAQIGRFSSTASEQKSKLSGNNVDRLVSAVRTLNLSRKEENKTVHADGNGKISIDACTDIRNHGGDENGEVLVDSNAGCVEHGFEGQHMVVASETVNSPSPDAISSVEEDEITKAVGIYQMSAWSALHAAHLLGIIEHVTLTVVQALSGSADDIFSNLSFLMRIGFKEKELVDTIFMHPSLMAIDLEKSLSRVMKCLQKAELDASFLKQVLIVQPKLVPLLETGALQERVKVLRKLNFPPEDVGTLLKRLGTSLLKQFLSLPVEKIESNYNYITDNMNLRNSEAIKLITSYPSVLLRDIEEDYAMKLKVLKEIFEELNAAKKLFKQLPELLARKTDALEETVLCLKDTAKDLNQLKQIVEANPSILTHRRSGIEPISLFLQSLGFDGGKSVALIAQEPYLIECGSDRLKGHVEFLKSKNFDESCIHSLMENSTGLFFKSLEKRLAPKIDFLENQGISGESLQNYMRVRPQVCDRSLKKSLNPNLEFLLSLGFEKNSTSLKSALKVILPFSHKSLQFRVSYMNGLGINNADLHKMIREEPSLLVIPDASLKKRVDFLLKEMKCPVQDLVKCPSFLTASIRRVILPRLKVFEWLCSKGLLAKFSLSTLVKTDESVFMKRYVLAHPEAMSIYTGSSEMRS